MEAQEQPSRNRQFHEFNSREGQQVLRLYRLYLSLLTELEEAAERPEVLISAQRQSSGIMLVLKDPRVAYQRSCLVPKELAHTFTKRMKRLGLSGRLKRGREKIT